LQAAKRQIRHHLRNFYFTDELSILSVTDDTFGTASPQPIFVVNSKTIEETSWTFSKYGRST